MEGKRTVPQTQQAPAEDRSDEAMAQAARDGDQAAFEELVARFQVPLLHFLQNRTGRHADAEDILQDTFLRAYQNLHRYESQWRFSTWLYTIAYRLSVSHHRRRRPQVSLGEMTPMDLDSAGPAADMEEAETRGMIWPLARRLLSEQQFSILWMHYVEQIPLKEIAQALKKSSVSVRAAVFRARQKLKPHLQSLTDLPEPVVTTGRLTGCAAAGR